MRFRPYLMNLSKPRPLKKKAGQGQLMNRMLYDVILPGHPEMVAGTSNSASTTAVTSDGGSSSGGVFIPRDPQGLVGFDAVQGARVPSTMLHDHTDPYLTQRSLPSQFSQSLSLTNSQMSSQASQGTAGFLTADSLATQDSQQTLSQDTVHGDESQPASQAFHSQDTTFY